MLIHEIIKTGRRKQKQTQSELAYRLGMSARTYRRIEKGELDLTLQQLIQLSIKLSLDPWELFSGGLKKTCEKNKGKEVYKLDQADSFVDTEFQALREVLQQTLRKIDQFDKKLLLISAKCYEI